MREYQGGRGMGLGNGGLNRMNGGVTRVVRLVPNQGALQRQGFTAAGSAERVIPVRPATIQGQELPRVIPGGMSVASDAEEHLFPLAAFLITEGTEDSLHDAYQASYLELDRAGGTLLLFVDIGNPRIKGPEVRKLVEAGLLTADPNDAANYELVMHEAGGEMAYRRLEIVKLRERIGLAQEEAPFIVIVSIATPTLCSLLHVPRAAIGDALVRRDFWKLVCEGLSESALRSICPGGNWDESAMAALQTHIDRALDSFAEAMPVVGASFTKTETGWRIVYGGVSAALPPLVGLTYLHVLLAMPEGKEVEADALPRLIGGVPIPRGTEVESEYLEMSRDDSVEPEIVDKDGLARLQRDAERKRRASDSAEETGDLELAEKLDKEVAQIEKLIRKATDRRGRPRRIPSNRRRAIESVQRAIHRAIDRIGREHPAAGEHFRACVKVERDLAYRPSSPVKWIT